MLWVAFSRRMCCSRVCSASTKPRRPSTSVVSPAIRPGIRRRCSSVAAKKPNEGPPKSSRLPSGWPSPDRDVDAALAGRAQDAERDRVDRGDAQRARLVARRRRAPRGPRPRRGSSGSGRRRRRCRRRRAAASSAGSVSAALEPDLDHLGAEAARVGLEGRPARAGADRARRPVATVRPAAAPSAR